MKKRVQKTVLDKPDQDKNYEMLYSAVIVSRCKGATTLEDERGYCVKRMVDGGGSVWYMWKGVGIYSSCLYIMDMKMAVLLKMR